MIDWLGRLGAELAGIALIGAMFILAVLAVVKTQELTEREWAGWLAGLVVFVGPMVLFGPAQDALVEASCEGVDDYEACIDGE